MPAPRPLIPLMDLKLQYEAMKIEINNALTNALTTTQFILGKEVAAFEEEFAQYCTTEACVGVNSGTSALHLSLVACGVGPGDEVITVPFTFIATVAAIGYTGAQPVFVDVEPRTLTMDVAQLESRITERTKAIIPVHLYGQCADMDAIMEIAGRYNLRVIEDACQAHGAEYKGRRAGSLGHMGCFSFYPSKNLGAYGEAGAITLSNAGDLRTLRMLRDWGQEVRYQHVIKGFNARMEGFQGAILRAKLRHLDRWTNSRRRHAATYTEKLANSVVTPHPMTYSKHVYHLYTVRTPRRDAMQKALNERGVQTGIHYPTPVHLQPAWADLGYRPGDFPVSELAATEVLSLPMFPELTDRQALEVVGAVKASC